MMIRCIDCKNHTLICWPGTTSNAVVCEKVACVVDPHAPKECEHFESGKKVRIRKPTPNVFNPKRHHRSDKR